MDGWVEGLTERHHKRHKHLARPAHSAEVVGYCGRVVGFVVGWDAAYGVGFSEEAGEGFEGCCCCCFRCCCRGCGRLGGRERC